MKPHLLYKRALMKSRRGVTGIKKIPVTTD
jgi:hypothetical protein